MRYIEGGLRPFTARFQQLLHCFRRRRGEYGNFGGSHPNACTFSADGTIVNYVTLYNQQLPQSALASRTPSQAMKDKHKLRPEMFIKQPYYLTECDI
jgi:hypothetical protein